MDRWIDMQVEARRFAARDAVMLLTDNAVGAAEEENLRHLASNLAADVPPSRVLPFLTCKHSLEYCLLYAARAASHGYEALTVLGGDRTVGPARCVPHAYQLRQRIRERLPHLGLGGWANPHRGPAAQVDYLLADDFTGEFFLTQVVSHHQERAVAAFVDEAARRNVEIPGVFGVFFYRSANPATLSSLARFLPVPVEEVSREFAAAAPPEEICARSIRMLADLGVTRFYVANLGVRKAAERYRKVLDLVDV